MLRASVARRLLGTRAATAQLRTSMFSGNSSNSRQSPLLFNNAAQRMRLPQQSARCFSSAVHALSSPSDNAAGSEAATKHQFKAETKRLLEIVASSLYSEKEVFIRELVSNASDALEKLRYKQLSGEQIADPDVELAVRITVDTAAKTLTIEDTGIGMSKEELTDNLGTIAKSGSKAFVSKMQGTPDASAASSIIGQFGVGFYSSFMVGSDIEVISRPADASLSAHSWRSQGLGEFEVAPVAAATRGSKVTIHLKQDALEFAQPHRVVEIVKKYCNFVGFPVYVNGDLINTIKPMWTMMPSQVQEEDHTKFFQFVSHSMDVPRYHLHYHADAPIHLRALLYVPKIKVEKYGFMGKVTANVSLYTRKVMIKSKMEQLLPEWLRFVHGVVDSEDIPLNLSRELLQDSVLVSKLKDTLASRMIKLFADEMKKDLPKYKEFFSEFGSYLREGIIMDLKHREALLPLLLLETSAKERSELMSLSDYVAAMPETQKDIYYLCAQSRALAEASPYMESFRRRGTNVLLLTDPMDEFVMQHSQTFQGKRLVSIDSSMADEADTSSDRTGKLSLDEEVSLRYWLKDTIGATRVSEVKGSSRLVDHPAVIINPESQSARRYMRMMGQEMPLRPQTLEINPGHPLIKKLNDLRKTHPKRAALVAEQLFDNTLLAVGLLDEPAAMIPRINAVLEAALQSGGQDAGMPASGTPPKTAEVKPPKPKIILPNQH